MEWQKDKMIKVFFITLNIFSIFSTFRCFLCDIFHGWQTNGCKPLADHLTETSKDPLPPQKKGGGGARRDKGAGGR